MGFTFQFQFLSFIYFILFLELELGISMILPVTVIQLYVMVEDSGRMMLYSILCTY